MPKEINIDGKRYGKLFVVETFKRGKVSYCRCRCDCGKVTDIRKGNLNRKKGGPKTCGCSQKEKNRAGEHNPNYRHGHGRKVDGRYGSSTHRVWRGIKDRCLNPRNSAYPMYGGRGIDICDRWMHFENFLSDMGERPEGMSIDRIDNDAGYSPENCRWATQTQQVRNARSNVMNFYFTFIIVIIKEFQLKH